MYGVLVVTHGEMAKGIVEAARMIYGELKNQDTRMIEPIVLREGESPEALDDEISLKIQIMVRSGAKGVLMLSDLFGSSTTSAGIKIMLEKSKEKRKQKTEIAAVSGVNLPMLLELIPALESSKSIDELAKLAVDTGRKSIMNVAYEIAKRKKK